MKAIICFANNDIHIHSFGTEWTACVCGNTKAKWIDSKAGTVVVAARIQPCVRLLGLNNHYLIPAIEPGGRNLQWEEYRELHAQAVEAPGYLFDKSKIGCWAAVVRIGRSNDVRWATDEEYFEAFPEASPDRIVEQLKDRRAYREALIQMREGLEKKIAEAEKQIQQLQGK